MNTEFWLAKWRHNEIGFHTPCPHRALMQYFSILGLAPGGRVFVPLCGKTLDIHWLMEKGYKVVGVELSHLAVEQLFSELGIEPVVFSLSPEIMVFEGPCIKIFVADIFLLTHSLLGPVDAVYDRAALVALPEDVRIQYTQHIIEISRSSQQFLICVEYDQSRLSGPPYAVMAYDVERYYGQVYNIASIDRQIVTGGIKGKVPGFEHIWILRRLNATHACDQKS
ncbi:thiopurine S-methyltransferase [Acetobacter fabarum]|uniref:thiopurine S-methyltransferase n=1 Tax=Acetobacter fabarum TaxID=483199 RepID=UPI00312B9599